MLTLNDPLLLEAEFQNHRVSSSIVRRFENWLVKRGYQLQRDPFLPEIATGPTEGAEERVNLVAEYLGLEMQEEPYRNLLLGYAANNTGFSPLWGDGYTD